MLLIGGDPSQLPKLKEMVDDEARQLEPAPVKDVLSNLALQWLLHYPRAHWEDNANSKKLQQLWQSVLEEQPLAATLGGYPISWVRDSGSAADTAAAIKAKLCSDVAKLKQRGYQQVQLFIAAQNAAEGTVAQNAAEGTVAQNAANNTAAVDTALTTTVQITEGDSGDNDFCGAAELHLVLVGDAGKGSLTLLEKSMKGNDGSVRDYQYPARTTSLLHVTTSMPPPKAVHPFKSNDKTTKRVTVEVDEPGADLAQRPAAIRQARGVLFARSKGLVNLRPDRHSTELRRYLPVRGEGLYSDERQSTLEPPNDRCYALTPRGLLRWRHQRGFAQGDMDTGMSSFLIYRREYHPLDQPIELFQWKKRAKAGAPFALGRVYPKLCALLSESSAAAEVARLLPVPVSLGVGSNSRQHQTFRVGDVVTLGRFFAGLAYSYEKGADSPTSTISTKLASLSGLGSWDGLPKDSEQALTTIWRTANQATAPVPKQLASLQAMMVALLHYAHQHKSDNTSIKKAGKALHTVLYWVTASQTRWKEKSRTNAPPLQAFAYFDQFFRQGNNKANVPAAPSLTARPGDLPDADPSSPKSASSAPATPACGGESQASTHTIWQEAASSADYCLRRGESLDSQEGMQGQFTNVDGNGCLLDNNNKPIFDPIKMTPEALYAWWYGHGTARYPGVCQGMLAALEAETNEELKHIRARLFLPAPNRNEAGSTLHCDPSPLLILP